MITCSKSTSIIEGVYELMSAYYIFDIAYPRIYAMALSAIQELAMEDPCRMQTGKRYKLFLTKIKEEMRKILAADKENDGLLVNNVSGRN